MGKKKVTKKTSFEKSTTKIFSTPVSKRNLNVTYVRSAKRPLIPADIASRKNAAFIKHSKKLRELGLPENLWKTFRINALYDFKYQKPMLRRYEQKLKLILESDISKIGSDFQYKDKKFEVEMQYFYSMAFGENDFPPLKIIIDTEGEVNDDNVYFTGILMSVERKEGVMEKERRYAGAAILPLFLVAYTDRIFFESVKFFLEDTFSCSVSPLKFSSCDLVWMLALFSPKNDQYTGPSYIEYDCPFEELKTIELAIDPYTVIGIWNRILDPSMGKTICEDQVYKFIQTLEYHFFAIFKMNLSEFDLQAIKTPLARVTANHSIIPNDTNKLYFVMRHLTHIAQETVRL